MCNHRGDNYLLIHIVTSLPGASVATCVQISAMSKVITQSMHARYVYYAAAADDDVIVRNKKMDTRLMLDLGC
jgi:hypothetical protein